MTTVPHVLPPDTVEMFTDGACKGNPGAGGWGVLMRCRGSEKTLHGGELDTTNNRMELTAAIEGLKSLTRRCNVVLTTDSQYVKNGIQQWIAGWKKKNWMTASKQPVKNQDLWKVLDALVNQHDVEWAWVKGHSGHAENERADELANLGCEEILAK